MAKKHLISGDFTQPYIINVSGHTWIFTKQSEIVAVNAALYTAAGVDNTTISIAGRVESTSGAAVAISSSGVNFHLTIEKGGEVLSATRSVTATAEHARIENAGTSNGIRVEADHSTVINSGTITDFFACIRVDTADDWSVVNEKSGRLIAPANPISPYAQGVFISSAADDSGTLRNFGLIRSYAVSGGDGIETVINKGRIESSILLYANDDVFDNRGGRVIGEIRGGAGNDTLIAGRATDMLTEAAGEGMDTVKASFDYRLTPNVERLVLTGTKDITGISNNTTVTTSYLHGNSGDNELIGLSRSDELSGGKGRDTLTGGYGSDVFELAKGSGRDTVVDYTDEEDRIAINGFTGVTDITDVFIQQRKGYVEIDMGKGDVLILMDARATDLESGDFLFNYAII